ncbi:hypothetical protein Tco_1369510 [Tanacetum coccineum]
MKWPLHPPIWLMARALLPKSWLWHQRLSYLNFDTSMTLPKNDLVSPVFQNSNIQRTPLSLMCARKKQQGRLTPPKPVPQILREVTPSSNGICVVNGLHRRTKRILEYMEWVIDDAFSNGF